MFFFSPGSKPLSNYYPCAWTLRLRSFPHPCHWFFLPCFNLFAISFVSLQDPRLFVDALLPTRGVMFFFIKSVCECEILVCSLPSFVTAISPIVLIFFSLSFITFFVSLCGPPATREPCPAFPYTSPPTLRSPFRILTTRPPICSPILQWTTAPFNNNPLFHCDRSAAMQWGDGKLV